MEFNYRPPRTLHLFLPTHPKLPINCLTTEVAPVITALFLRNVSIQLHGHVVAPCCFYNGAEQLYKFKSLTTCVSLNERYQVHIASCMCVVDI